jgi:4-hydroxy-3-polyprenylbenzoate decarboxylase
MIVVSGDVNIRDYRDLLSHVSANVDLQKDLLFSHGPLDVLDHSSDNFSFGGKLGIDATVKHTEEASGRKNMMKSQHQAITPVNVDFLDSKLIKSYNISLLTESVPVIIVSVNRSEDPDVVEKVAEMFRTGDTGRIFSVILIVDHTVDVNDLYMVAWQLLGNTDPERDHEYISTWSVLFDGTIKAFRKGGFPRKWPNVVCSDISTIASVDQKWDSLGTGVSIDSPSSRYNSLCREGADEILIS